MRSLVALGENIYQQSLSTHLIDCVSFIYYL